MDWADDNQIGCVYLIHLHAPGNPETCSTVGYFGHRGGTHYVGFTVDLEARLSCHKKGQGSRFLREGLDRGLDFSLVRVWENKTRRFEAVLKNERKYKRLCPVCSGPQAFDRRKEDV